MRPSVTVPVSVEQGGRHPAGPLQHLGPADEDAELGAPAGPGHDRGRGGQAERARAGHDEHGHGGRDRLAGVVAGDQPAGQGDGGDAQDHRHEHACDPVGQALHRGLGALGGLDQPHDLGQGGVGPDPGRPHHQPALQVDGGPGDVVARADLDRDRLAGQQRPVDRGAALLHHPVGGQLLAGPDHEPVADRHRLGRDRDLGPVAQHHGRARAQLQQAAQGLPGAAPGPPSSRRPSRIRTMITLATSE
jgi:hypothetical protein